MSAVEPASAAATRQPRLIVLRSALFNLIMWLSVLVYAPLTLFTFPFPFAWRYRFISQWARFQVWLLEVLCGLDYCVEGLEHLPRGPAIVLAKHQSAWETIAFQCIFPPQTWVLKRELLWVPFFGWGLALLKPIAIRRGAGRQAIEQLVSEGRARLEEGIWVVIFPEGTRVAPGTRGRYRIGGAVLAAETGYPVVPVAHNAGLYWRRRSFVKRPGTIRVVVGPVIDPHGKRPEEILAQTEAWIEARMPELEGRVPPNGAGD
jgi:1-acyl-sn-glycerol-3-phosphate acyltransferase